MHRGVAYDAKLAFFDLGTTNSGDTFAAPYDIGQTCAPPLVALLPNSTMPQLASCC